MKTLFYFFLWVSFSIKAQNAISTTRIKESPIVADAIIGIDNFGTVFFTKTNTIYKKNLEKTISYNNLQLGALTSANSFNPLKINLFYQELNTLIILDNRLAEIFKIDFNSIANYKNVSHVTTGFDNTVWLFNQDDQILEVFDYKKQKTIARTLRPIDSSILDITSNYNYCYVLTPKKLLVYNYFGSLVRTLENTGFETIEEDNETLYLKKGNTLALIKPKDNTFSPINLGDILITQFFVTNETLYIYNNKSLQELQINIK
jgi:hypothetical protein